MSHTHFLCRWTRNLLPKASRTNSLPFPKAFTVSAARSIRKLPLGLINGSWNFWISIESDEPHAHIIDGARLSQPQRVRIGCGARGFQDLPDLSLPLRLGQPRSVPATFAQSNGFDSPQHVDVAVRRSRLSVFRAGPTAAAVPGDGASGGGPASAREHTARSATVHRG